MLNFSEYKVPCSYKTPIKISGIYDIKNNIFYYYLSSSAYVISTSNILCGKILKMIFSHCLKGISIRNPFFSENTSDTKSTI
jgi:hypothetical protein